jgi:polyphosphate kinase 2 (PPK2 family)
LTTTSRNAAEAGPRPKLTSKQYEREMRILQGELVAMQEWVTSTGGRGCVVITHVALLTPTEREKSHMYIQRRMAHFPSAGEVAIFDRS